MDKDVNADDRMGQAVLDLSILTNPKSKGGSFREGQVPFEVPVTRLGQSAGKLTGKIQIVARGGKRVPDGKAGAKTKSGCCLVM